MLLFMPIVVNSHSGAGCSSLHPGPTYLCRTQFCRSWCSIARTVNVLMKALDNVNKYEMKLQLNFMRFIIVGYTFSGKKTVSKLTKGVL